MAVSKQPSSIGAVRSAGSPSSLLSWTRSLSRHIANFVATCVAYYTAAILYERLRGLSDVELARRSLNRVTLARDICEAGERKDIS